MSQEWSWRRISQHSTLLYLQHMTTLQIDWREKALKICSCSVHSYNAANPPSRRWGWRCTIRYFITFKDAIHQKLLYAVTLIAAYNNPARIYWISFPFIWSGFLGDLTVSWLNSWWLFLLTYKHSSFIGKVSTCIHWLLSNHFFISLLF